MLSCSPVPPVLDACCLTGTRRLEFDAFCELALTPYLHFARVRLGDFPLALRVVDRTFTDLAEKWAAVLNGPCAPATAWALLQRTIIQHRSSIQADRAAPSGPHDMVVLHCLLGLSERSIAHLRGMEISAVAAQLAFARRTPLSPPDCRAHPACPRRSHNTPIRPASAP
ncbi:hypothetical protein [Streptomyces lasiicapitis]|uniref:hypothetical protein n=1 Tax=Streptomyces lasiicapitis TaxID=1923961 RepID=UPI0036CD7E68